LARTAEVYSNTDLTQGGTLPLLTSALVKLAAVPSAARIELQPEPLPLIPSRPLTAGEQYRFHFDMTKCIGCKCCVVACNEQNGNPAGLHWRRVGELEGGHYPLVKRHHLSMGCNHCLEPSCLIGCPVEAYRKDPATGVVIHNADTCIGCQYCTWNCSYGVPQYNPERGVVGKCDLCHNRLADGMEPACVSACPENAIAVELVDIEQWRADYLSADAPGLPSAGDSISTTRVTLPRDLPPDTGRVDMERVMPEHPHWPLVFMLVLTQLSVGAFAVLATMQLLSGPAVRQLTALAAFTLAGISLGTATLHLGRPIYAWRAWRGLRRSWLSREVLALSIFAGFAGAYTAAVLFELHWRMPAALAAALFGAIGVVCSARIYMVPARPAWASRYTLTEFAATGCLLGPLFVCAMEMASRGGPENFWLVWASLVGAGLQLAAQFGKFVWLARSDVFELRASALLLSGRLRNAFLIRLALLVGAGIAMPLEAHSPGVLRTLFVLTLVGEWLGRWLFFVSVVPKNMAAAFTRRERAA
jgi:formate dehydrogenase iron-sulfur subunit